MRHLACIDYLVPRRSTALAPSVTQRFAAVHDTPNRLLLVPLASGVHRVPFHATMEPSPPTARHVLVLVQDTSSRVDEVLLVWLLQLLPSHMVMVPP